MFTEIMQNFKFNHIIDDSCKFLFQAGADQAARTREEHVKTKVG